MNRPTLLLGGVAALVGLGVAAWLTLRRFDVAAFKPRGQSVVARPNQYPARTLPHAAGERRGLKRPALLLVVAAALVGLGVAAWLGFGGFDVAASRPHSRLTYNVVHAVLVRTVQARSADAPAPPAFGPERVVAGFRQYDAECVRCHGAPGVARDRWADWMNPSPPYLIDVSQRYDARQLFWLVCHGAKMTGMPAWGSHRSDDDVWNIVAFLRALPYVPPAGYAKLHRAYGGPDPAGQAGAPDARCLAQP